MEKNGKKIKTTIKSDVFKTDIKAGRMRQGLCRKEESKPICPT